jgi:hypothetical protein
VDTIFYASIPHRKAEVYFSIKLAASPISGSADLQNL